MGGVLTLRKGYLTKAFTAQLQEMLQFLFIAQKMVQGNIFLTLANFGTNDYFLYKNVTQTKQALDIATVEHTAF